MAYCGPRQTYCCNPKVYYFPLTSHPFISYAMSSMSYLYAFIVTFNVIKYQFPVSFTFDFTHKLESTETRDSFRKYHNLQKISAYHTLEPLRISIILLVCYTSLR